jgi:hypothetical protein
LKKQLGLILGIISTGNSKAVHTLTSDEDWLRILRKRKISVEEAEDE